MHTLDKLSGYLKDYPAIQEEYEMRHLMSNRGAIGVFERCVGPFDNSDAAIKNCEVRSGVASSAVYCPKCGTDGYVKVARDENGMIKVRCLDCGHDGSMTNEQYYGD